DILLGGRDHPWDLDWGEASFGVSALLRAFDIEPYLRCRGEFPSIRCLGEASGWRFVDRRLALLGTVSRLGLGFWRGCIRSVCRLPIVGWRGRTGRAGSAEYFETQYFRLQECNSCNLSLLILLRQG